MRSYYYDLLGYIRLNKCSNFLFNKPKLTIDALLGIQDGTLKHWMVKAQNQTQKTSSRFGGVHCRNPTLLLTNGGWKTVRSLGRKWQIPVSDGLKGSQGDLKIKKYQTATKSNGHDAKWDTPQTLYDMLSTTLPTFSRKKNQRTFGWTKHLGIRDECFGLNFGGQVILLSIGIPGKDSQPVVTPIHRRQVSEAKCVQMPRWLRVLKLWENFIEFIKVPTIINIMYLYRYASFVFAYCQSAFFRP